MINHYKFSREDIVKIIKTKDKTEDGHYWFPDFDDFNELKGNKEDSYYYSRDMFKHKMYFTDEDIQLYTAKKKKNTDIDFKYRKAVRFYEINKELKSFNVNDIVPPNKFTVAELIDAYEYII